MAAHDGHEYTYRGRRTEPQFGTASETVVTVQDNTTREVNPLPHLVHHSPTGLSWGYGGSGPADLARSILGHHLGGIPLPVVYQDFKFDVVARWTDDDWSASTAEIEGWLEAYLAEHPGQPLTAPDTCRVCGDEVRESEGVAYHCEPGGLAKSKERHDHRAVPVG